MKTPRLLSSVILLAACTGAPSQFDGTPLAIPSYAKDDPRPGTGGFVRDVRLVETSHQGTKFILMAWEVGDVLTLGAMTEGPFDGSVVWQLGEAVLAFDCEAKSASSDVAVAAWGAPADADRPVGTTAGFRGYRWTNIELASPLWFDAAATPLSLTFKTRDGAVVSLPKEGRYAASRIAR